MKKKSILKVVHLNNKKSKNQILMVLKGKDQKIKNLIQNIPKIEIFNEIIIINHYKHPNIINN
jgi:hypothetical protein